VWLLAKDSIYDLRQYNRHSVFYCWVCKVTEITHYQHHTMQVDIDTISVTFTHRHQLISTTCTSSFIKNQLFYEAQVPSALFVWWQQWVLIWIFTWQGLWLLHHADSIRPTSNHAFNWLADYTNNPSNRIYCCTELAVFSLAPPSHNHQQYSLCLPTEERSGRVGLGGLVKYENGIPGNGHPSQYSPGSM